MIAALQGIIQNATISYIFLLATLVTLVFFVLRFGAARIHHRAKPIVIWLLALGGLGWYIGPMQIATLGVVFLGAGLVGYKVFGYRKEPLTGWFIGLLALVEIYALLALLFTPWIGFSGLFAVTSVLLIYRGKETSEVFSTFGTAINRLVASFNPIDIWLLIVCFLVSSQPQSFWDAVQANLYIAKWYIDHNSLATLTEAISSLFPQNAIVYYALFYQIAAIKGMQLAILLPVLFLIVFAKQLVKFITPSKIVLLLVYGLILSPMVVFQGVNGYYDLLVAVILLAVVYVLFANPEQKTTRNVLLASFLIGFDAAIKYFPMVFALLPLVALFLHERRNLKKAVLVGVGSLVIAVLPLLVWTLRTYLVTGSPVYPFMQTYFPTPLFWPPGDILEASPMMATAMTTTQWLTGGFLRYPIDTFFRTSYFLETVQGFPGLVYIVLMPYGIFMAAIIAWRAYKRRVTKVDIFLIYAFVAYFIIGVITRYYRYLWPYQLLFSLFLIVTITDFLKYRIIKILTLILAVVLLSSNIFLIKQSFKFFPIFKERLLAPDYYFTSKTVTDPILFINNQTNDNKSIKVLDVSKYLPGRFQFAGQVYQCNWYWINITDAMNKAKNQKNKQQLLSTFDYVISTNPPIENPKLCADLVAPTDQLFPVYSDQTYLVYKVIK